ncbi:MAG: hypothetical protein NZ534_11225, partial [Bacteroidia bacterium]|nr:hypothetical protein [Bacteroidia bacterium]
VRHVAFVRCSVANSSGFDPADLADWNAAIVAGDATVIANVRGTYDGGAATENAGYGDVPTELTGMIHTLTYFDPRVRVNCNFYNQIKYLASDYRFFFFTATRGWRVLRPVRVFARMPVAETTETFVNYEVTVKWSHIDLPCPFDSPFDDGCLNLPSFGG